MQKIPKAASEKKKRPSSARLPAQERSDKPQMLRSITWERKYGGYLFILPWIIGFLVFFSYPLIQTILLSFSENESVSIDQLGRFSLDGFGMYQKAFITDTEYLPLFSKIVGDTVINTILILIFSLFVALLLNKNLPGKGLFRAIFFLPVILGTGTLSTMVIDSDTAAGIMALDVNTLSSVLSADMAEVVMNLLGALSMVFWRSSVQMVIYLSGLQGISDSLYESADCDGATAWEMFWKITLPMLAPVTLLNLVYTIIDSFTSADNKMLDYIYTTAFKDLNFSYGAAMSVMYLLFALAFVGVAYAIMAPRSKHASERA